MSDDGENKVLKGKKKKKKKKRILIHTEEKPYDKSVHTGEEPYIDGFIIVGLINKPGSQE